MKIKPILSEEEKSVETINILCLTNIYDVCFEQPADQGH